MSAEKFIIGLFTVIFVTMCSACASTSSSSAPSDIKIGSTLQAVEQVYGDPVEVQGDCRVYPYKYYSYHASLAPMVAHRRRLRVEYQDGVVAGYSVESSIAGC